MIEVGRLVVKTNGRDAGKIGVIVEKIDNTYVLIDGQVRRRKCNIAHIELLAKKISIKPKATTDTIKKELKKLGIEVKTTKPKTPKERQKKQRKVKKKEPKKAKTEKKIKVKKQNEKPRKQKSSTAKNS